MKLPTSIRVGPHSYSVEVVPINAEYWGKYDPNASRFKFTEGMTDSKLLEVLIHEINHAIWDVWGIGEEDVKEEPAVRSLGMGWATVYQDNPELLKTINKLCIRLQKNKQN